MTQRLVVSLMAAALTLPVATAARSDSPVRFNTNFEGGSLGKVEQVSEAHYRCAVQGQYDEHGRNRQANWYYFRLEGLAGREIAITFTDLVGEYDGRPGACPMNPDTIPVFSHDNEHWQHFPGLEWDDTRKEGTIRIRSDRDRLWIAHVPPYPHAKLLSLLAELDRASCARLEVIGKTVQGRDLHLVTVTDFNRPDAGKKIVWLLARQHAWETGTSYVIEGALRFISSEQPEARRLRAGMIFRFLPMLDPDGCATGKVRFNANGYDLNRHWDEVDLRSKVFLHRMPEIWYAKKAILSSLDAGPPSDLMINLHNTETVEYLETLADAPDVRARLSRLFAELSETSFDPSGPLRFSDRPDRTTNSLARERQIPVLLMEQRIGTSKKLGRRPTVEDRRDFGRQLITALGKAVMAAPPSRAAGSIPPH